ncbi:MAG: energy transducer TonB [Burkholderiaceae bacterium]|nr:energy transducer TonB [Burkholderiaceae bacterium]MEB2319303.1 energy transducer TonB [Pseudomonadota bacterium]
MITLPNPAAGRAGLRDPLMIGVGFSLLLHLVVLAIRFAPPSPLVLAPRDSRLEVVLLNAGTVERPLAPDVVAQVDMQGGGDRDEGRATSPLVASTQASDGEAVAQRERRVRELEELQRRLLARASEQAQVRDQPAQPEPRAEAGEDREQTEQLIARLQAQIERQISDYNKRPRRLTFGVNAVGVTYARYVSDWAARIEQLGTERYPAAARGRIYDSLVITVEIDKHGNVVDIVINRKSQHEVLNRAVKEIVFAGAPYEPFPLEMAREGDILQIVRTWTFTNGALQTSESQ